MKHIGFFVIALLLVSLILSTQCNAQQKDLRPPELPLPEMEQDALRFVETNHHSSLDEIKRLKIEQPEQYSRTIMDIYRRSKQLEMIQKNDPRRYDMEIRQEAMDEKTIVLAHTYQNAKDEKEKQEIKHQIQTLVNEQFDLREQIKESEVKRMEGDLQRLKEKLKLRKTNRSEIVNQRVNQLLNIGSGLGWD